MGVDVPNVAEEKTYDVPDTDNEKDNNSDKKSEATEEAIILLIF